MTTLEEAWGWYETTRDQLHLIRRLGERYWDELPWEKGLNHDSRFRDLEGGGVAAAALFSLSYLDDLAIVVLFSVFEATVRLHVRREMGEEAEALRHRALRFAAAEAMHKVEEGGFFHVLEPFKDAHADLVEEVHQVRRYRNWVAHGKKGEPRDRVVPQLAYGRLRRFLEVLSPPNPQSPGPP